MYHCHKPVSYTHLVIVPANTYIATLLSILRAGLKPMLCEPSFETCNIDAAYAETLITPRTRAILPVHLYGRLAGMKEICKLANRYGLKVIELSLIHISYFPDRNQTHDYQSSWHRTP